MDFAQNIKSPKIADVVSQKGTKHTFLSKNGKKRLNPTLLIRPELIVSENIIIKIYFFNFFFRLTALPSLTRGNRNKC